MWMTQFVKEVKKQLRDVYGHVPSRTVGDEPCFDHLPDAMYLMDIEGKLNYVAVINDKFYFLQKKEPVA